MNVLSAAMIGAKAAGGPRLCGDGRTDGGIYLECGLNVDGSSIEAFLIDPPHPVDPLDLGVSALGVTLWEDMNGIHHVLDMVGQSHYPYVSDFIEEGRIKGFSRKVSPNIDFAKITPGSKLIFLHARARVDNYADYTPAMFPNFSCPCGHDHEPGQESCLGLHWRLAPDQTDGIRVRKLGGGNSYGLGLLDPQHPAPAPAYVTAMFASVPITSISLIAHGAPVDPAKLAKAQQSGLPVDVCSE